MPASSAVLLVVGAASKADNVRLALEHGGFIVQLGTPGGATCNPEDVKAAVVDSAGGVEAAAAFCRRWRDRRGEADAPLIWLADSPDARMTGWQAGADAVLACPLAFGELAAQIDRLSALAEDRRRLSVRAGDSTQINQTLLQLYQQCDADYRIARRIQSSCRPLQLPAVGRVRFAVSHRERIGSAGDFHNVIRVDEDHVAFFVGDVMGRSVTASVLAVFIYQNISPKEIDGKSYRVLPPDEVLQRLGRNLATLGMPDPPFVQMTYAVLNCTTGELSLACAGHTPALHIPQSAPLEWRRAPGPVLAPGEGRHQAQQWQLQPGDRLLLFTDGIANPTPQPFETLRAAAEARRSMPLPGLLAAVTQDVVAHSSEPSDFTILGLEFA